MELIVDIGPRHWENIAASVPGRTGKQCRERWNNQLCPLLKKSDWSSEESLTLCILQRNLQNRWAEISQVILGRPDNSIKNRWNSVSRHQKTEQDELLEKYVLECCELDNPDDMGDYR